MVAVHCPVHAGQPCASHDRGSRWPLRVGAVVMREDAGRGDACRHARHPWGRGDARFVHACWTRDAAHALLTGVHNTLALLCASTPHIDRGGLRHCATATPLSATATSLSAPENLSLRSHHLQPRGAVAYSKRQCWLASTGARDCLGPTSVPHRQHVSSKTST